MGNIKNLKPLSEWLEFELETDILDPPVVKFKLRPISGLSGLNVDNDDHVRSSTFAEMILDSIQEWDLTDAGNPVPCNAEMKQQHGVYLRILLGSKLKGKRGLLGIELANHAADPENFLKN